MCTHLTASLPLFLFGARNVPIWFRSIYLNVASLSQSNYFICLPSIYSILSLHLNRDQDTCRPNLINSSAKLNHLSLKSNTTLWSNLQGYPILCWQTLLWWVPRDSLIRYLHYHQYHIVTEEQASINCLSLSAQFIRVNGTICWSAAAAAADTQQEIKLNNKNHFCKASLFALGHWIIIIIIIHFTPATTATTTTTTTPEHKKESLYTTRASSLQIVQHHQQQQHRLYNACFYNYIWALPQLIKFL